MAEHDPIGHEPPGTVESRSAGRRIGSALGIVRQPMYANAYALVANQVQSAALGLVYWSLASHLYGLSAYGTSSATISIVLLISAMAQLGLGPGMTRFMPRAGEQTRRLILLGYATVVVTAAVLGVVFVALGPVFGIQHLLGRGWFDWIWVPMAAAFWSVFQLQDKVLIGLMQAKWVLIENTIFNVMKLALLVALVRVVGQHGIVSSWFLPAPVVVVLVTWLVFGVYTRPERISRPAEGQSPPTLREVATTSGGDHIGLLASEAAVRLLPVVIVATLGAEANGRFYSAWLIATTLGLIAGSMTDSFTAQAAADREQIARYSRNIMAHMAAIMIPAAAVLSLGAPFILGIFGKGFSRDASALLRLLCLSSPLILFNSWYLSCARILGRVRQMIWVQVIGAVLLLGVGYALLRPFGIEGVGVAWLLSQTVLAVIGLVDARGIFFPRPVPGKVST